MFSPCFPSSRDLAWAEGGGLVCFEHGFGATLLIYVEEHLQSQEQRFHTLNSRVTRRPGLALKLSHARMWNTHTGPIEVMYSGENTQRQQLVWAWRGLGGTPPPILGT